MKAGNWIKAIIIVVSAAFAGGFLHSEIMGDAAIEPQGWVIELIGCLIIVKFAFWLLGEKFEG